MNALVIPISSLRENTPDSRWHARLELRISCTSRGSRLSRCRHRGPLYVQKPFYPEGPDLAHIYLLHPPGGLVSGDLLQLDATVEAGAKALFTTPGAGRVYRARFDRTLQQQCNHLVVADGASLEWLPLENIVYRGANACLETRVELGENSHFMGWEVTSLGLPASGVDFDRGQLQQRLIISREGRPLLIEALQLSEDSPALYGSRAGMQGLPINGIFVAGPFDERTLDDLLLAQCREVLAEPKNACLVGVSVVGGFLLARYLGSNSEQARRLFVALWQRLRPHLIGRPGCAPRIWST
ncbi:MAG: urease accessory protein [Porticoccus sp.]|mgnify:CR=1 FL=1|jgi:urease accessory protein|nr:urease accessory protein [Porticoccus sp.]